MKIRKPIKSDIEPAIKLFIKSYKEFVAPSFTKRGRKFFEKDHVKRLREKMNRKNAVYYVALKGSRIIGVVGGGFRGKKAYISSLAVDSKYHRIGIGKKLMDKAETAFSKKTKKLRLNSSTYAIDFYKKLGYKKTKGLVRTKEGVTYQPMIKNLRR
jgi:ribosomal protein S18 acetylase RimI-like enzyme